MKSNVTGIAALALALCLLPAVSGQEALPSEALPEDVTSEEAAPVPSGFPEQGHAVSMERNHGQAQ